MNKQYVKGGTKTENVFFDYVSTIPRKEVKDANDSFLWLLSDTLRVT